MAKNKNIEPYEEDDFLLEEQNSNEEPIAEEDEDIEEETVVNLRPRPARASLTHNAIKSEILKMNKQNRSDSNEDADENLSRSARKRKKRREKILEERRVSGGRSFEDDLDHFKSIPISRRRSSVLQTVSIPNHNNGNDFCSKFKCCLWVLLVVGTLIGLLYIWPTVAELDLELADQVAANENQIQPEQPISNEIDDQEERIINNINKLNDEIDDQNEKNQNEEESLSAFNYISSFFATEEPDETTDQQNDEQQNDEQQNDEQQNDEQQNDEQQNDEQQNDEQQNEDNLEYNSEQKITDVDNDKVDEGFDEQINEPEENLENTVPERYQSAIHQEDNLEEEDKDDSCLIGGVSYKNLNEEQCNILQKRQIQLEEQLLEQEQLIRQEQQTENNDETFYFF